MLKPSTSSPVALSSVFGRAPKTGRRKGGSALVTMNSSNGANGSRRRSRSIARRDLILRHTPEFELHWQNEHSVSRNHVPTRHCPCLLYLRHCVDPCLLERVPIDIGSRPGAFLLAADCIDA